MTPMVVKRPSSAADRTRSRRRRSGTRRNKRLRTVGSFASDHPASQRWYWTEPWQRGERIADAELAAGLGQRYASGEELLAALEATS